MPIAKILPDDKVCSKCGRFTAKCSECNNEFFPQRRDTITCSGACRVARSRRIKKAREAADGTKLSGWFLPARRGS